MALNPKQAAFVAAYIRDPNATRAAKAAGYAPKSAGQQGWRNLNNPNVRAIIQRQDATPDAVNAVDIWHREMTRLAYHETPTDEFKYDHKLRAIDMIAKAEGRYASESGAAAAFNIQINLGPIDDND